MALDVSSRFTAARLAAHATLALLLLPPAPTGRPAGGTTCCVRR